MALQLGINSFVTSSEANRYFEDQFLSTDWFDADEQDEALVTASGILNRLTWKGTRNTTFTSTYPLAWPRNVILDLPIDGTTTYLSDDRTATSFGTIPTFLKHATFELALNLIRNGLQNLQNVSGAAPVRDLTVGSIRLVFDLSERFSRSYVDIPELVFSIISPYLGENVITGTGVHVNGGA